MRALHASAARFVLLGALSLNTAAAFAQPPAGPRVQLAWNAPSTCPSEGSILAEMQRILGGPPSRAAEAMADVEELAPRRWSEHLSTHVEGVPGERTLEADSCEGLAAATSLILAWTIDPERASGAQASPPAPGPQGEPPIPAPPLVPPPPPPPLPPPPPKSPTSTGTATATSTPTPTSTPTARRARVRGVVATEVMGDLGTLQAVGVAWRLTAGVLLGRVRFEASFADWLSQRDFASDAFSGQGTALHILQGSVRGCFRWEPAVRLEVDPCLGASLLNATSNGFGENQTFAGPSARDASWGSVDGDVLGAFTLAGPVALRATLGLAIPLERPEFVIDVGSGPRAPTTLIQEPFPVAGRATLGVEVRFP